VFVHVPADLAQKAMVDRLVRGIAILELAEDGHVGIDTQQREYKLLEVRALVFAVAMGDLERCLLALATEVIAVEAYRWAVSKWACCVDTGKPSNAATDSAEKIRCVPTS